MSGARRRRRYLGFGDVVLPIMPMSVLQYEDITQCFPPKPSSQDQPGEQRLHIPNAQIPFLGSHSSPGLLSIKWPSCFPAVFPYLLKRMS